MSTNPPESRPDKTLTVIEDPTLPTMYAGINRGQLELLKRTIAKGTTDDEFALFMNTAMRLRLDPFARQIYAVKRWDSATREEVMQTQVAIDGYRAVAEDTGRHKGTDGPFWCGEDEVWKDVWISEKPPRAAKVLVYKDGIEKPYVGVASYKSYVQKGKDGGPRATWGSMPDVMLGKCAEAQALRKAFPKLLSGTHTPDEVGADGEVVVDMTKVATALPAGSATPATAPTANAAPPAQAKTPSDTWPAFLADLAPHVAKVAGLAEHVIGNADVATWGDKEIEAALAHLLTEAQDPTALNDVVGPWINVINKHTASTRVAMIHGGFKAAYAARMAKLREAKKNGGAAP
jgi:phage recombination protein Bet